MELRLDTIAGVEDAPNDVFVSFRVGDSQKQSRLVPSRTYRFPSDALNVKGPFGRIEVFRRVAVATVPLDSPTGERPEVEMDCGIGEAQWLRFRVSSLQCLPSNPKGEDGEEKKKGRIKDRMDDAKRFLDDNRLEDLMAEAMREVIRQRPEEPYKLLAEQILSFGETMKLPAKPSKAFVFKPSVGTWIMQKSWVEPDEEGDASPVCQPVVVAENPPTYKCFQHMPSVGGWYMDKPLREDIPFILRPSVGTWLAFAPTVVEEDIVCAAEVPAIATPEACGRASVSKVPLGHLPSAGTWLAPRFYARANIAEELPVVGSPGVTDAAGSTVTELQEEIARRDRKILELQAQMQRLQQVVGEDTFASMGIELP
jgi:hypothetical protein